MEYSESTLNHWLDEFHEISVEHHKGAVGFAFLVESDLSLAILEIDSDNLRLVALLLAELKVVDAADFSDDVVAVLLQVGDHALKGLHCLQLRHN